MQWLHEMNVVTRAPTDTHNISLSHTFTQTHKCTCTFRPGSRAAKRWIWVNVTMAYRTLETPNNLALTHNPEYFFNITTVHAGSNPRKNEGEHFAGVSQPETLQLNQI